MTLCNMRANGVRTLAAWCLRRGCKNFWVLVVGDYSDDVLGGLTPMAQSNP
jgi:hypothetical protein